MLNQIAADTLYDSENQSSDTAFHFYLFIYVILLLLLLLLLLLFILFLFFYFFFQGGVGVYPSYGGWGWRLVIIIIIIIVVVVVVVVVIIIIINFILFIFFWGGGGVGGGNGSKFHCISTRMLLAYELLYIIDISVGDWFYILYGKVYVWITIVSLWQQKDNYGHCLYCFVLFQEIPLWWLNMSTHTYKQSYTQP